MATVLCVREDDQSSGSWTKWYTIIYVVYFDRLFLFHRIIPKIYLFTLNSKLNWLSSDFHDDLLLIFAKSNRQCENDERRDMKKNQPRSADAHFNPSYFLFLSFLMCMLLYVLFFPLLSFFFILDRLAYTAYIHLKGRKERDLGSFSSPGLTACQKRFANYE